MTRRYDQEVWPGGMARRYGQAQSNKALNPAPPTGSRPIPVSQVTQLGGGGALLV